MKRLKILFSAETLYPPIGGADISIITLLNKLSEKHDVSAVYIGEKFNSKFKIYPQKIKRYKGNWINAFFNYNKWQRILKDIIRKENPDFIITQELFTPATHETKENIPVIAFVRNNNFSSIHGFEFSSPENDRGFFNRMSWKFRIQYPFYKYIQKRYIKALKKSIVFSVSRYIQKQLEKFNIKSQIIRPFIDLNKYKTKPSGENILYIGPSKAKGQEIFLKIVERMPERKFVVVGNISNIKKFPNLEIIKWTNDMKSIYKKTRLLLVPSVYPDPCPRVVIEAGVSGIPSLVSSRGGLPEEVEPIQVINNLEDIEEWIKKIKQLDNSEIYGKLSRKAKEKARQFSFERQYNLFSKKLILI